MQTCDSNNHPNPVDLSGFGSDATCYEWCCADDEYWCNDMCNPQEINGETNPPDRGEITPDEANFFPVTCCIADDCCVVAEESWNDFTFPPQCCASGFQIADPFPSDPQYVGLVQGCCGEGEHYCANLANPC